MISNRWIQNRHVHWDRLESLLGRASHGLGNLSGSELQELGLLYRQTAADLSAVAQDRSCTQIAGYLNHLLAKSHNILYSGADKPTGKGIVHFYRDVYPRIFRETLPLTVAATLIFFVAMLVGWVVTARDPGLAYQMLGPKMIDTIEQRKMWTDSVVSIAPLSSSFIMTNNMSVAFTTFALGITGIGTVWMMVFNGLLMGVVSAATWHAGMALSLWSFVAPHGVLELPAIFIAGGAGLELARGLLFPGFLPRKESLAHAGQRAMRLVLGVIPLLLVAGTIEGFFSPSKAPVVMKFTLAAVLLTGLVFYLFFTGRTGGTRADSGL